MQHIAKAFRDRGFTIHGDIDRQITVHHDGNRLATISPIGYPEQPPVGSDDDGQHYSATIQLGSKRGDRIKLRPGDDVGDFAKRVITTAHDWIDAPDDQGSRWA